MEEDEDDKDEHSGVFSSHSELNIHMYRKRMPENTGRTKSAVTKKSTSLRGKCTSEQGTRRWQKPDLQRVNQDSQAEKVGLGVYMVVDRLTPGQYFVGLSIDTFCLYA